LKVCLSIAGSDPSSGAGVQQDLKTFTHFGVYGVCVVTGITSQNTKGVEEVYPLSFKLVENQLNSILSDIKIDGIKIGMLCNREIVEVVGSYLKKFQTLNIVLDPLIFSKNRRRLLTEEGVEILKEGFLNLVALVTPNILEASILTGMEIESLEDMKRSAVQIHKLGAKYVLVKGGHLRGEPVDILYNGKDFKEFRGERIDKEVHGIGCAFSSAITALLALGMDMEQAIRTSKGYITKAISKSISIGQGYHLISLE